MKKMILAVFACLVLGCFSAAAQPSGWEVSLGVSLPGYDRYSSMAEVNASGQEHEKVSRLILPAFSLQGGYIFGEARLGVFLHTELSYAQAVYKGGPAPLTEREPIFYLMPQLRLYYKNAPNIRLYATVGGGLRVRHFAETLEGDTAVENNCSFAWQISPFGVSAGERWVFSFDFGAGFAWTGVQVSVGYRF